MANTLRFKRGLVSGIPTAAAGEPLFTTDTFDLYIGNGTTNTRFQKYIASGTTSQYLRGDGSLATFPSLTGFVPYTGATANVDLGVHTILAQNATFASNGSTGTATINHTSGSGIALNITKGGNGEGLYINKTSGSGNAATIIGTLNATTLVKSGGTSSQYLMADGSTSTLTNPVTGTGVAGQVAYWSGANTQVGSNNLFWDATNNRLGIGTATPTTRLYVTSPSANSTFDSGSANDARLEFRRAGTRISLFNWDTGLAGFQMDTGSYFYLSTGGSERLRLDASGNLGLGVTPSAWSVLRGLQVGLTASVSGYAATTEGAFFSSNSFYDGGNFRYQVTGFASTLLQINGEHRFQTAASGTAGGAITFTRPMTLTANGRLLLGTTTEGTQRLQVAGNVKFDADAATNGFYWDNTNKRLGIGTNSPGANLQVGFQDNTTNEIIRIGVTYGTADAQRGALTWHDSTGITGKIWTTYNGSNMSKMHFGGLYNSAYNQGNYLTIQGDGSVGIGTTNPTQKLQIAGNSLIVGGATWTTGVVATQFFGDIYGSIKYDYATTNFTINSYGLFSIATNGTTPTTKLTVYADGNTQIGGSSNTGEKLQVNGTMKVTGASTFGGLLDISTGNSFIYLRNTSLGLDSKVWALQNLNTSGDFRIRALNDADSNGINAITISRTGISSVALTFGGAATFSSSVTAASLNVTGASTLTGRMTLSDSTSIPLIVTSAAANTFLAVDNTNANLWGAGIDFRVNTSSKFAIGTLGSIIGNTVYDATIYARAGLGFRVNVNDSVSSALIINSTGAATFSSSVTIATNLVLNGTSIEQNNASGLTLNASNASGAILFRTAGANRLTISNTGLATFTDNARFSNLKGCIFTQTGGTLLGSISMDSSNQVTIDNNGFFGLSVGSNYTMTGGNLGIGHNGFGTSATRTISVLNGTAPSTSPTDSFQIYSNDVVAGNAAPHFRTENGAVIKLYQETTAVGNSIISLGGGSSVLDDTTFDGYTLRQIVKALRNQGILA